MFKFFAKAFKPAPDETPPLIHRPVQPGFQRIEAASIPPTAIPIYPPQDGGIPVSSADELLASQKDQLARIRQAGSRLGDQFDTLLLPAIRNYAEFVSLLPATSSSHHRGAGGLFRLGLEVGFTALQASGAAMFSGKVPTEGRRDHEDRWQVAAFLAGLVCEQFRAVTDMTVNDGAGHNWPAYEKSLVNWANEIGIDRVFITWQSKPIAEEATRKMVNALLFNQVTTPALTQWLNLPGTPIVPSLLSTIVGIQSLESTTLMRVVSAMHREVVQRDMALQPSQYGLFTVGSHLEPYLIDGMRRLVREGRWLTNEQTGDIYPRLWNLSDGLYLIWSSAATELISLLKTEAVPGIPAEAQTLVEMLLQAKIVTTTDGQLFAKIRVLKKDRVYDAVRIANPALLFTDMPPISTGALRETEKPAFTQSRQPSLLDVAYDIPATPSAPPDLQLTPSVITPDTDEKKAKPRKKQPDIPAIDAKAATVALTDSALTALEALTQQSQSFLQVVFEDIESNETSDLVGSHPRGLALAEGLIEKYGLKDGGVIAKDLSDAGWLAPMPSGARWVDHTVGSRDGRWMIVLPKYAALLKSQGAASAD